MCKHGHPLEGENLYAYTLQDGRVKRNCKACMRENARRMAATHPRKTRAGGGVHPLAAIGLRDGIPYLVYAYGTAAQRAALLAPPAA